MPMNLARTCNVEKIVLDKYSELMDDAEKAILFV